MSSQTRISYFASFTTEDEKWLEIKLPVSSFLPTWRGHQLNRPPINPEDVTSLGFMIADNRNGPFKLGVDWVGLGFKQPDPT